MPKRALGLGQAAKAKKQKADAAPADSNQLTVELGEEVDANDSMAQLGALWRNFIDAKDRSELMLNGIIHECDRILRKCHREGENTTAKGTETETGTDEKKTAGDESDAEVIELSGAFYGIYGLALSMLGFFHTEEPQQVQEYFRAAQERISTGFDRFPDSLSLKFAQARLLINRIPLMEVSAMTLDSRKNPDTKDSSLLLDECLAVWEEAEKKAEETGAYEHFSLENSDFLQALDDLLDMVDNFGKPVQDAGHSDDESDEEEDVVLNASHPLYSIVQTDKYNVWWREHTVRFLANLDRKIEESRAQESRDTAADLVLRRELSKRLGQSYLMEAEVPSNVFTALAFFEKDKKSLNGMTLEEARAATQKLLSTALEYLRAAQDEEDPASWAAVAEAMISLGNTYEVDSSVQEETYNDAEKLLVRANNATNGRYDKVLENLQAE